MEESEESWQRQKAPPQYNRRIAEKSSQTRQEPEVE